MSGSTDQFWTVLWRRRVSFIAAFAVVMAGVAIVTFSLPKVYSTSSYLLVSTLKPTGGAFEAQQVSQVDTQTVAELLQTRNAANTVAAAMPYRISPTTLQGEVSISPITQTNLVVINAHESTPLRAQQLANTYANAFVQQASSTVTSAKVTLAAPAALVTSPSAPRPKLYLLIGAILALLIATGVALLRQRLDQRLGIDEFATELFGLPILARVPSHREAQTGLLADRGARTSPADAAYVESFRLLFANLTFATLGSRPGTIAIVSATQQEGKTTIAAAIAQAATETADSVLLVDCDLRQPSLAQRLGVSPRAEGVSNCLAGTVQPEQAASLVHDIRETRLQLMPSGPLPPNPSSLLGLPSLAELVRSLRGAHDFIVFDTPPVSVGADASLTAAQSDGAILVVDARASRRASTEWALQQLRRAHVNVLGVIVNRAPNAHVAPYRYTASAADHSLRRTRRGKVGEPASRGS